MGRPSFSYGYVIVIAAFVIMAVIWGTWATFGVFFEHLAREFGWSRAAISGANALNNLVFGLVCIFSAGLSIKLGARKVIFGCSILLGASYFLLSLAGSLAEFYLYFGVLVALGMSSYIPMLSLVAHWFSGRRGLMTGLVFSGMGMGTILFPLLANYLTAAFQWRMAFIIIAALSLVITASTSLFIRKPPAHIQDVKASGKIPANSIAQLSGDYTLKSAARTRQFLLLCLLYFCFLFCLVTIMVHVVVHATGTGIARADAATILSIIGGSCIAGMNVAGFASDRTGLKPVMAASYVLLALSLLWLLFAGSASSFFVFAIVFGFAYGGIQTLFSPLVARIFGLRSHGTILGAAAFAGTFGAVIGPVAAGSIYDISGNYAFAFVLCGLIAVAGVFAALLLSIPDKR